MTRARPFALTALRCQPKANKLVQAGVAAVELRLDAQAMAHKRITQHRWSSNFSGFSSVRHIFVRFSTIDSINRSRTRQYGHDR
jgi:hypothetical protein